MIKSRRMGAHKGRHARRFRAEISKTHPKNVKQRGWMRGGIRL